MKNSEIIYTNKVLLVATGEMEPEEEIHTYAKWQELGYQVRKGEKAITNFQIWKFRKPKKDAEGDEIEDPKPFKTKAYFFKTSQVDKIA